MKGRTWFGLSWLLGATSALVSGYGWWFHFAVGPAHGPGRELGVIAGVVSVAAFAVGWRLSKSGAVRAELRSRRHRGPNQSV